jgi:integrase
MQFTDTLVKEFRAWRKVTPIPQKRIVRTVRTEDGKQTVTEEVVISKDGVIPKLITVNRHIRYIKNSFDSLVARGKMLRNPIMDWRPEKKPAEEIRAEFEQSENQYLTLEEFREVLTDKRLDQDYITIGSRTAVDPKQEGTYTPNRLALGYTIRDIILLLFCACKRRKEILTIMIEHIYFELDAVAYNEWKNQSKGPAYGITKAFHTTEATGRAGRFSRARHHGAAPRIRIVPTGTAGPGSLRTNGSILSLFLPYGTRSCGRDSPTSTSRSRIFDRPQRKSWTTRGCAMRT